MFVVTKRMEIAAAHKLNLSYDSPCSRLHGHNWIITVEVCTKKLNKEGMVMDFTHISEIVRQLDHKNLNEQFSFNPTAENIAAYIFGRLGTKLLEMYQTDDTHFSAKVTKVTIQESEGNIAVYIP